MQERVCVKNISPETSYEEASAMQEAAVADVLNGGDEVLFFAEHAPIYTLGTSANEEVEVLASGNIPTLQTGRGGKTTYHGPGQRVLYPILNLNNRGKDLRNYVCQLQKWIITTLKEFNIEAFAKNGDEVGVWVSTPAGEAKIAAIGVRVRKWITFHGIALNVSPNMEHYKGIIPCGIEGKGVTSMKELGFTGTMTEVDETLRRTFEAEFSSTLS